MKKRLLCFLLGMLYVFPAVASEESWLLGNHEGGGGFYMSSHDHKFEFALLGYAQAEQDWLISKSYEGAKTAVGETGPVGFQITRARLDFIATMFKDFELIVEPDFAPKGGGLVLAQITAKLVDNVWLQAGKFTVPFSTEGYRSSRDFDTINRYMTINTMYFIPTQDVQYGAMLFGKLLEGKLGWFLSVTNGNSDYTNNGAQENNTFKEVDAKLTYELSPDFKVGIAGQYGRENDGPLNLYDLTYTVYNTLPVVSGKRFGFTPDLFFKYEKLEARAELMYQSWPDSVGSPVLWGGFAQAMYFLTGDRNGGFAPILRGEYNKLTGPLAVPGSDHLSAILAGWNWFINANLRHQLNFITSLPGGAGTGVYANGSAHFALLSQLQMKF